MIINIHTTTRFFYLDLAWELHKKGLLGHYLTTEPGFIARKKGLPRNKIHSLGYMRVLDATCARAGLSRWFPADWMYDRFGAKSAKLAYDCDLLVHISYKALPALKVCRTRGIPFVTSHGNTHVLTQESWVREASENAGVPYVAYNPPGFEKNAIEEYAQADFIEVPSRLCAETFVNQGVAPEKMLVNLLPVQTDYWLPKPKPDPRKELRFLFAGSIQVRKGVSTLLEAWRRAKPERAGLYFSVSSIAENMKPLLSRYEGSFTVLQPMANQTLFHTRINDYHVVVLPSYEEGFSCALAQGMSCGLAPLSSDRTGAQEIVTHGRDGLLFKPGDVDALEAAIRQLCADRDLSAHLGENARALCLQHLTPQHYGERAIQNYRRVLEPRQDRRGEKPV